MEQKDENIKIFNDKINATHWHGFEIVKKIEEEYLLTITHSKEKIIELSQRQPSFFVSKFALISNTMCGGVGCIVLPQTQISLNCKIGNYVFLDKNVVINHDVVIGDYTSIQSGVIIQSGVEIGKHCQIGAGTIISTGTRIGAGSIIGIGSVVLKDTEPYSTNFGNPSKKIN